MPTEEPLRIVHTRLKHLFQGRCLDIGCYNGRHLKLMPGGSMGIDVKDFGLKNVMHIDLNKNKLPFPDDYFDTVLFSHVIEHLDSPHLILKEIHRITKSTLVIGIPNMHSLFNDPYKAIHEHIYVWEYRAFIKFLEIHGFKIKKIYRNHPTKSKLIGWLFNTFLRYYGNDYFFVCTKVQP